MSLHNNPSDAKAFTRRQFLSSGMVLASASLAVPMFLQKSAWAMARVQPGGGSIPGVPEDRILVVVQMGGGNDGLNTVCPVGFDEYYRYRPTIGIRREDALMLSRGGPVGLHPQLAPVKELYDEGLMTVVQGVGYPNPNRSHFSSMDIWHTGDMSGTGDGWLGRYYDAQCCGYGAGESGRAPAAAGGGVASAGGTGNVALPPPIAIGRTAPLAMQGRLVQPVSFETADLFRWTGQDVHPSLVDPYTDLNRRGATDDMAAGSNVEFLTRTALDAQVSSDLIRAAVSQRPLVDYPRSGLGQQMSMVASMIRAGMKTRVYYVDIGGFDTHAGQGGANGSHANLLGQWAQAVRAFYRDLKEQGNDGRVMTMSFSEFGRRVGQNASGGTDHGTAAPLYLFGPMVKAGVHGDHPSMTDLDDGDLKYRIDFRTVYAAVLKNWMGADPEMVLEGRYRPADVVRT